MSVRWLIAISACVLLVFVLGSAAFAQQNPPGVVSDGSSDDTAPLQAALDQAGKTGGSVVLAPGLYLIEGSLTVPTGVTLQGSWEAPHHGAWDKGTTLLITGGRGQENGPAAITLSQSSALRGVTMVWPEEKADNIVPYPWAVHGYGMHNTVENVTFVNAYQGILIGEPGSELHLIRNVFGCVLRRGIFIDSTSDIGRIENVHFNTHYWARSQYPPIQLPGGGDPGGLVSKYTMDNLEAFLFGRADWEYVENTFVWGAHIGYHFIQTPDGACNGQFMGIGADACNVGLQVDHIQPFGIQVTNGEFTAFTGEPNAGIVISPGATGAAQFVNCNFWSTPGGAAQVHGNAQVTFSACHFADGGSPGVIVANNGHVIVNACSFGSAGKAVVLEQGTRSAIVTSNMQPGGLVVDNKIGGAAQIGLNETEADFPAATAAHYLVKIGTGGDEEFLGDGWYPDEGAQGELSGFGEAFDTARWTNGDATLHLPVRPGAAYTLTIWLLTRPSTPPETISAGGHGVPVAVGKAQRLWLAIPASYTKGRYTIDAKIAGAPWEPAKQEPGSSDSRHLGVRVFAVEMKAANGPAKPVMVN